MRYLIYIAVLVLLAAGLVDREVWVRIPAVFLIYAPIVVTVIFVLTTHALALLTVSKQRRIFGNIKGIAGRYPEAIVPLCVLSGWAVVGALTRPSAGIFVTGIIFTAALAVCYALVRVVTANSTKSKRLSAPTPKYSAAQVARLTTRGIYLLRIFVAVVSAYGLLSFAVTGYSMIWSPIFAIVALCLAALLALCGIISERALAQGAGKTAKQAIAAQLTVKPTDLAIYYSGTAASKHTAPAALANQLAKEGALAAVIVREAYARKALIKAPSSHLWFCPTINTLDAVAQPDLKVIFYVNDAAKNGHFIRFNDYTHVLKATGRIAAGKSLPQSCDVYDVVIAPNAAKAEAWRAAATPDMARRIVTVGKSNSSSTYLSATKYPSEKPLLTLHLGGLSDTVTAESLLDALQCLIEAVTQIGQARLEIWFPAVTEGAREPLLRGLHRAVEEAVASISVTKNVVQSPSSTPVAVEDIPVASGPLISHCIGTPVKAANAADFPIATAVSNLDALRSTGKPLLWFGSASVPDGFISLQGNADSLATALELAWSKSMQQITTGLSSRYFGSFAELVVAMSDEKIAAQKKGATPC